MCKFQQGIKLTSYQMEAFVIEAKRNVHSVYKNFVPDLDSNNLVFKFFTGVKLLACQIIFCFCFFRTDGIQM